MLLQGGDEATLALWRRFVDASTRYFGAVYETPRRAAERRATSRGESFYNPMLAGLVDELEQKGLARRATARSACSPPGFTSKEGEPLPLIVRKQDGGYGYAATDLAAIRYRTADLGATRLLYVVGAPQQQHFAMVFAVAKLAGWLAPPARAEHVAFGSILGPDKKMFKTRAGGTVKLAELLDEAVERAPTVVAEKNPELDDAARDDVARDGRHRRAQVRRPLERSHQGLRLRLGSHARVRGQHRAVPAVRARAHPLDLPQGGEPTSRPESADIVLREPAERALALELLGFGAAVASSPRRCSRTGSARTSSSSRRVHHVLRALPGAQGRGPATRARASPSAISRRACSRRASTSSASKRPSGCEGVAGP